MKGSLTSKRRNYALDEMDADFDQTRNVKRMHSEAGFGSVDDN